MEISTRIPVPGTYNFRDVGGLPARDGVVRRGALFRSDGLHRLGDEGRDALRRLDVGMIIDLRDDNEARLMPDDLDGLDVEVHRLPVFEGSGASQGERGISLEALYHRIVTRHSPILVDALRALPTAGDRAVVVHCTAGKDRTGMVVAMALLGAGVERESVIADYVLTESHLAGEWLEEMVALIGRYGVPDTPALRTLMGGSPREALESALDEVERQHGSAREYLLASGLQRQELEALETWLIERG
ncbi:protein-tyrosine phosphatase [Agromyces flavus]|uniref:Protein-tyrosine phosphatase n=1 Tax=Agromyces flavus TaxID=589382 RepID=A0A1H1PBT1_9MICO|nr:tyrosine-protein phosphatase [Agromyces flavus]MCP2367952.1 protein-tyrosine phosphatase [Agromyces flavus]GGI47414.1 phosphotyrosine protein phosphatase [Agromyces flavus]SDS08758.1 protein-tyrosine phosphatase [Agromyces flavus]